MNCLIINTSKPDVLVALVMDGKVVGKETWQGDTTLGTTLLSVIDELLVTNSLKLENIDRIAVHRGPGHYSALRSGIVGATFLAQGSRAELMQVEGDTMEEMISQAEKGKPVETVVPRYTI